MNIRNDPVLRLIIGLIVLVFILSFQSCSTTKQITPSDYINLGEIDSKEYTDYQITLIDGTKYSATDISVSDSILTINAISSSGETRSNVLISGRLPFSIRMEDIDSIESRKATKLYAYIAFTIIVLGVSIAILGNNPILSGSTW